MEVKTASGISGYCSSSSNSSSNTTIQSDQEFAEIDLRRGPWTVEEDFKLINYIASHGEGRWNSLARCAGLKRTGKSCRLRWLNYLRPDVRRGNITLEEQLLILELHSRWGNRWSKIAQHLPGRTDNEIKNYWRTRVQKHAKQLKCDVNSKQFKDTMRYLWMPRLIERIQAANANAKPSSSFSTNTITGSFTTSTTMNSALGNIDVGGAGNMIVPMNNIEQDFGCCSQNIITNYTPENSSTATSSDSFGTQVLLVSDLTEYYNIPVHNSPNPDYFPAPASQVGFSESSSISPTGYFNPEITDFHTVDPSTQLMDGGDASDDFWNVDDLWLLQQQFHSNM